MSDKIQDILANVRMSVNDLYVELNANEYVLATVITNLRHMRGNPDAADLLLDWYDLEGLPMIQRSRK